jgi:hypothetical protein
MGIFTDSLIFNCWKCRKRGHLSFLLSVLTGMDVSEAEVEIAEEKFLLGFEAEDNDKEEITRESVSPLPKYFEKIDKGMDFPLLHRYLKRRKISPDFVIRKGCGVCRVGEYMNRMIIPVIYREQQVSFIAADMTGTAYHKYMNPGTTINQYLYGYDNLNEDIIVVAEGILDAWRIGKEGTAIFGSYLTDRQKALILEKNPYNLVFCLDGDAYWHARKEAAFFQPYIEKVEVIRMDFDSDPDKLGTQEIWHLIEKSLFPEDE